MIGNADVVCHQEIGECLKLSSDFHTAEVAFALNLKLLQGGEVLERFCLIWKFPFQVSCRVESTVDRHTNTVIIVCHNSVSVCIQFAFPCGPCFNMYFDLFIG